MMMNERKVVKENRSLHHALEELRLRLERESEGRRMDVEYVKEKEKVKFETERAIFVRSNQQKDIELEKLREELKYVTTLIQYLKMGDENIGMASDTFNPFGKQQTNHERSQDMLNNIEMSLNLNQAEEVRERVKTLF